jgi:hypothetical protein
MTVAVVRRSMEEEEEGVELQKLAATIISARTMGVLVQVMVEKVVKVMRLIYQDQI